MTIIRKLTATTAAAAFAAAGTAAAAAAPIVSKQRTSAATKAPLIIPGTGIEKGERLPRGARLVFRDVTLEGKQTARLTITAPAGKKLRGLAPREGQEVGFVVTDKRSYVGRTKVRLRAYANPKADGEVAGRIYGLVR